MVPASCGIYSGAEPSGLRGSLAMLRNGVSTRRSGVAWAAWAAASDAGNEASDAPARAAAESCMVSRREILGRSAVVDVTFLVVRFVMGKPPPDRRCIF